MKNLSLHAARRRRLLEMIEGICIVPTAPHHLRNRDSHYPFRFDSHFYYLTGFAEPKAVLVMVAGQDPKSILFCLEKDMEREIWDGYRYGPEKAKEVFAFDETHPISALEAMLPNLIANQRIVSYPLGQDEQWDRKILAALNEVSGMGRSGVSSPAELGDIRLKIDEMRLFKDKGEIELMKQSAGIASGAHKLAMKSTRPGKMEYEIEAELLREFRRMGAQSPAYTSIVAGGENACILHYVENNAELKDGDLLLIDAGCELHGYASDITRTFPVNGKFSPAQKTIYELVLEAQYAALAAVKPGASWNSPHEAAVKVLAQGFIDLGFFKGSVDGLIESGNYKQFYMHRTGHWLGLDVHDVGSYKTQGQWRALQPGMVLTVEPGCYIRPAENVPEAYWNIGIRIEDDVHVIEGGHEILSKDTPKTVAEIEDWMGS